jgi:low affinity Fe/Cu permease
LFSSFLVFPLLFVVAVVGIVVVALIGVLSGRIPQAT